VLARDYFEALLAPGRPKRLFHGWQRPCWPTISQGSERPVLRPELGLGQGSEPPVLPWPS
jgi:hypothetical protein